MNNGVNGVLMLVVDGKVGLVICFQQCQLREINFVWIVIVGGCFCWCCGFVIVV